MRRLLALSALLVATVTLSACGEAGSLAETTTGLRAPASSPTSQASPALPADANQKAAPADKVFGPSGVGSLRLGMTAEEVAETGTATTRPGSVEEGMTPGCLWVLATREGSRTGDLVGTLSINQGLETLVADAQAVTPHGIRLGSTAAEVSAALERTDVEAGDYVSMDASPLTSYEIGLSVDGVVQMLELRLRNVDCPPR
jgi:hypothetical protein